MKEEITQLRIKIDGLSQLVRELKEDKNKESRFPFNSPECSKTYDSLILAKAWLGKVLGELGTESPYANDGNRKTVEDIEPTADKVTNGCEPFYNYENSTHIEKVDWLRQKITKIIETLTLIPTNNGMIDKFMEISYIHISEARFWLGFELGRVRDENN